jgi:hypothetical protein
MNEAELQRILKNNPNIRINPTAGAGAAMPALQQTRQPAAFRSAPARTVATEHEEQVSFFEYVETVIVPKFPEAAGGHSTQNGLFTTPAQAGKAKAAGNKKGVPDISFPVARGGYYGLYIELKRRTGGHVSDEQKWYQGYLAEQGYRAVVCMGWEAAAAELESYLAMPVTRAQGVAA